MEESSSIFNFLPEDIANEIFSHLESKDLLSMTLVSKRWNEMLERSSVAMKKLTVYYNKQECDLECLLRSTRPYQNIAREALSEEPIETRRRHRFRYYYRAGGLGDEGRRRFKAILKKFAGSIVTLDVAHDLQRMPDFPKLKKVTVRRECSQWVLCVRGIMSKCKYIEEFNLLCPLRYKSKNLVQDALDQMERLKVLRIKETDINFAFLKSANFSLTEFKYDLSLSLHQFGYIKCHQSTLTHLSVAVSCAKQDILISLLTAFPKLATLEWQGYFDISSDFTNLPVNSTITTLKFYPYYSSLKLLPNLRCTRLEKLIFSCITKDELVHILAMTGIKTVEYKNLMYNMGDAEKQMMKDSEIEFIHAPEASA